MVKYFCDLCGKQTNDWANEFDNNYIKALQIDPYKLNQIDFDYPKINIVCDDCLDDLKNIMIAYVYSKTNDKEFNYDKIPEKTEYEYSKYEGEAKELNYVGFSSHDCESWYECPMCHAKYGSWGFFHMEKSEKEEKDGKLVFTCKCGTKLYIPD